MASSAFAVVFNFKSDSCRNTFSAKASFSLTVVGSSLSKGVGAGVIVGRMVCVGVAVGTIEGVAEGDCVGTPVGFLEGVTVGVIVHLSHSI